MDDTNVHFSDLGKQYGNDLAGGESEFIVREMNKLFNEYPSAEWTLTNAIDHLKSKGVDPGDIIFLAPWDPFTGSLLRLQISNLSETTSKDEVKGPDGILTYKGEPFASYSIFMRDDDLKEQYFVLDKRAVSIAWSDKGTGTAMGDTYFFFNLIDPLEDARLRKDIFDRKSDWLLAYPEDQREKLVGKFVWIRVLEGIDIKITDYTRVFRFSMPKSATEVAR